MRCSKSDVAEAYDRTMDVASSLNKIGDVTGQIRQLVESNESASVLFMQQSLHGRIHAHSSSVNKMYASEL